MGRSLRTALEEGIARRDELGRAARARAEALPWEEHIDRIEALLAEVAGER